MRILAIAWIPSLMLLTGGIAVSAVLAYRGTQIAMFTDRFNTDSPGVSTFAVRLMSERRASVVYLADPADDRTLLSGARHDLDTVSGPVLEAARQRAATHPAIYSQLVTDATRSLARLSATRQLIDNRQIGILEVEDFYSDAVEAITTSLNLIANAEPVPRAAIALVGIASLLNASSVYLQADELALAASIGSGLSQHEYTRYAHVLGGQSALLDQARLALDASGAARLDGLRKSPAWLRLATAHNTILLRGPAADRTSPAGAASGDATAATALPDVAAWNADGVTVQQGFAGLGMGAAQRATALSRNAGQSQLERAAVVGVLLLLLGVVVLVVTTRTSGRLISRLRRLREETLRLSHERLPGVVARLRQGEQVDVSAEVTPLDLGRDEIGQVARAFNQAQETAIAAAVGEAEARAGLRTVFLNIAHRSQTIVHRQLDLLDKAERSQEDPDQLGLLFELDHLTTRARRNAENLIILGGGQAGRQWRNPVPLVQVVRGAISEARDYVRVSLGSLPTVNIVGDAVADIIHVIAELVDNATSFSPPMSRVEVRGNVVGRGVVLEIEDQGLGIEPERLQQLNEMLHEPPDFQAMALADEPRLGIFVVAQLTARHGIRVTLTPSPAYGGTRAVALIPSSLVTTVDLSSLPAVDTTAIEPDPADPSPVTTDDDRPALPRRARQAHLVPQLRTPETAQPSPADPSPTEVDPDVARQRLAAFQHGTRRARGDVRPPEG